MSEQPLSIAEVTELPDGSWVNGGFTAAIRSIEQKHAKKTNKPFWVVQLADTTGSATAECAMFRAPGFREGDQVDFLGQGIKFTSGQYGPKISIGDKTEMHIVGKSAHAEEQRERAATGQPALNGSLQPFAGQSVSCSLNNAHEMMRFIYSPEEMKAMLADGSYWSRIWKFTSRHLEVARELEQGKLAKGPADKAAAAAPPPPDRSPATGTGAGLARAAASRGQPQDERQAANLSDERDFGDVQF